MGTFHLGINDPPPRLRGRSTGRTPVQAVEFIVSEALRVTATLSNPRSVEGAELLFRIPMPRSLGTGHLVCGREAFGALDELATTSLRRGEWRGRLDQQSFREELAHEISDRFFGEDRSINKSEVDEALAAALKRADSACIDTTYYLPCHLAAEESPDEFSIGPVTFRPRPVLMKRLKPDIDKYLEGDSERGSECPEETLVILTHGAAPSHPTIPITHLLFGDAMEWLSQFRWTAEVTIRGCSPAISKERAELAIDAALSLIRVTLGEQHTGKLRLGGRQLAPTRLANLTKSAGILDVSWSRTIDAHWFGEGWWDHLERQLGDDRFGVAAYALSGIADPKLESPLCSRLLDAFEWFGQAVVDHQAGAKVVKYITCVERLVVCGKRTGVTNVLKERAAALCFDFGKGDFSAWSESISDVYDMRSEIIHGSRSPLDEDVERAVNVAEHIARFAIIRALEFFGAIGIKRLDLTDKQLNAEYDRTVAWAKARCGIPDRRGMINGAGI